ncbi:MAG: LysR substrate-binding domain-containing protein [Magnetovibrio sp.]|nr:LysR substrate-binding domain-containing protein [Magnetovibrio sp.]
MTPNLDTDLLRTFVTVADEKGFTRAAETLGRTQSAISMQVKRLEELLRVRLFDREGRRVRLTHEGEALMGYARRMLKLNDEAVTHFLEPELVGPVRVGSPDDYACYLLPQVLSAFANTHPGIRVEVTCDNSTDLEPMVRSGELDLALLSRSPQAPGGELIRTERLLWITSPTHAIHEEDPVPLAMYPEGCICRWHAINALEGAGRSWRPAYASRSTTAIQGAVLGGFAVSIVEESTIPAGVRVLSEADGYPRLPDVEVALHRAPGEISAPAQRLAEHIRESLGRPARPPRAVA